MDRPRTRTHAHDDAVDASCEAMAVWVNPRTGDLVHRQLAVGSRDHCQEVAARHAQIHGAGSSSVEPYDEAWHERPRWDTPPA